LRHPLDAVVGLSVIRAITCRAYRNEPLFDPSLLLKHFLPKKNTLNGFLCLKNLPADSLMCVSLVQVTPSNSNSQPSHAAVLKSQTDRPKKSEKKSEGSIYSGRRISADMRLG